MSKGELATFSRRSLLRASAWSVPAVALAVASPASAASVGVVTMDWTPADSAATSLAPKLSVYFPAEAVGFRSLSLSVFSGGFPLVSMKTLLVADGWTTSVSDSVPGKVFACKPVPAGVNSTFILDVTRSSFKAVPSSLTADLYGVDGTGQTPLATAVLDLH